MKGNVGFHHFDHKGGLPFKDIVTGPHARVNGIHHRQFRRFRRNCHAQLSHDDNQGDLAHIGAFPAHVGSGQQVDRFGFIKIDAVGHIRGSTFQDWMTTVFDMQFKPVMELRHHIVPAMADFRQGGDHIDGR